MVKPTQDSQKEDSFLREKFKRIYDSSKRINLKKIEIIYEYVKTKKSNTQRPPTISEIVKETGLKRSSVRNGLIQLEDCNYIRKTRKYTPPYLKVTKHNGEVEFVYGKDKRNARTIQEKEKLLSLMKSSEINIASEIKSSFELINSTASIDSRFLGSYNKIIEHLWKEYGLEDLSRLEIGSGANRYTL